MLSGFSHAYILALELNYAADMSFKHTKLFVKRRRLNDPAAAEILVNDYAIKIKYPQWHENIYQRYELLDFTPHQGFINPTYIPVYDDNGALIDIRIDQTEGYIEQHLRYSRDYSRLPDVN